MSLLQDISTYLTSLGTVGSESATPPTIYQGKLPPSPSELIALFELPGRKPQRVMGGRSVDQPQLNVIARSTTYEGARTLAWKVFNALDGFSGVMGSTRYLFIEPLHQPWDIGQNETELDQFSMAFHVKKEPER